MAVNPDDDAERGAAATPAVAEPEDDVEDEHPRGFVARHGTTLFLLAVIVLLGAYASIPYWRSAVPDPYRSYLPDLPESETRGLIANLEKNVDANRTELARLRAEVQGLNGEVEEIADVVNPDGGNAVAEIGALKERIVSVETRLRQAASAAAPAAAAGQGTANGDVTHRLDLVAGRVDQLADNNKALAQKLDQHAIAERDQIQDIAKRVDQVEASRAEASSVLRLNDRISSVEAMARAMVSRHDASLANLLAVVQLRAKAADGQAFDAELRTARALAEDKAAFDAATRGFSAQAGQGVPTAAALRETYGAVADAAAKASHAPAGDSLWDKTVARVTGLVTVRRLDGSSDAAGVDSILARAGKLLDAGDLAGAAAELNGIADPHVAAALRPWLGRAESRVALDAALSTLTSDALARVAASAMQQPAAPEKSGG